MTTVLAFVLALPVVWCLGYRSHARAIARQEAFRAEQPAAGARQEGAQSL